MKSNTRITGSENDFLADTFKLFAMILVVGALIGFAIAYFIWGR